MLILIASGFRAASAMDPAAKAVILRVRLAIAVWGAALDDRLDRQVEGP
jgi:hypothetical protein